MAKDKFLAISEPTMPGFEIRRATSRDMDVLVEHRHAMFEEMTRITPEEHEVADELYRAWATEMMKQKLFHGYVVVTTGGGSAAASGCVWLRQVQPSRGRPASMIPYLMSIYTSPMFRRKGLASMIVKDAMAWAKRNGYGLMTLHASPAGRKVYSKLGWKRSREMQIRLDRPPKPLPLRRAPSPRLSRPARASTRHRPAARRPSGRG
jgi:GNAT superfamily N-acetyltransferase